MATSVPFTTPGHSTWTPTVGGVVLCTVAGSFGLAFHPPSSDAGRGALITGRFHVTAGTTYDIYVASNVVNEAPQGYHLGGKQTSGTSATGGSSSAILLGSTVLVEAGGGGAAGDFNGTPSNSTAAGGDAGLPTPAGTGATFNNCSGGQGGTASADGAAGIVLAGGSGIVGTAGSAGVGGIGGSQTGSGGNAAGCGGGGVTGGGGGVSTALGGSGGGGGASHVDASLWAVDYTYQPLGSAAIVTIAYIPNALMLVS